LGSKEHESGVFFYFYTSLTLVDGVLLCKGTVIEPNRCLVFLYTPKPKGGDKLFVVTKQLNESGKVELLAVGDIKVAQADLIRSDDPRANLGQIEQVGALSLMRVTHANAAEEKFDFTAGFTPKQSKRASSRSAALEKIRNTKVPKIVADLQDDDSWQDFERSPTPKSAGDRQEICRVCDQEGGLLLLCDGRTSRKKVCDFQCHLECANPPLSDVPADDWFCEKCTKRNQPNSNNQTITISPNQGKGANTGKSVKKGEKGKVGKDGKDGQKGSKGETGDQGKQGPPGISSSGGNIDYKDTHRDKDREAHNDHNFEDYGGKFEKYSERPRIGIKWRVFFVGHNPDRQF
jgi:hypothetical protein